MHSRLPTLAAMLSASVAFFVACGASAQDNAATPDERALVRLESDWVAAEDRRDAATLRSILDDQFIATFGTAEPLDKEAFIREETQSPPDPTVSQVLSDRKIIVVDRTAVIVETDTLRRDGKPSLVWRFTVTYIKRADRWLALAEQGGPTKL
jgi:hypothetical protein